ncbi:MAG: hypothetical protein ACRD13_09705 [Terriglobales bacterium]
MRARIGGNGRPGCAKRPIRRAAIWRPRAGISAALLAALALAGCHRAPHDRKPIPDAAVTTYQYNNARTGSDPFERELTPANVNARDFGRLARLPVDGAIYAQPLYMPEVRIPGKGRHNLVIVATENDSVYAFDACGHPGQPLWRRRLADPARGITPVPAAAVNCGQILPAVGITATPVIAARRDALYVLARTENHGRWVQTLHALDLSTGRDLRPPVQVRARVPGHGDGTSRGQVAFDPLRNNARAGLLLAHGVVYLAWASSCDVRPFHGWVMAYRASNLRQLGAWCATPDGTAGGIWQSGNGLAADAAGHIFFATGNGTFDANHGGRDYGDSVVELDLGPGGLAVKSYFTPFDQAQLDRSDQDLSSAGVLLLPPQPGPHPSELLAEGKKQDIYLLDRHHLGGYHPDGNVQIVESLAMVNGSAFSLPAYFQGQLYSATVNQLIQAYTLRDGRLVAPPRQGQLRFPWPGATPVISSDNGRNAVLWIAWADGRHPSGPAVLYALAPGNLDQVLYSSAQHPARDDAGPAVKFAVPTVAAGRVYLGTQDALDIYGLLPPAAQNGVAH